MTLNDLRPRAGVASLVTTVIEASRYSWRTEAELQRDILASLEATGLRVDREVIVGPGERIDFLVEGCVGVEVKTQGSVPAVTRQLQRYAHCGPIVELVLATTRPQHRGVPAEVAGMKVRVAVMTGGAW